MKIETEKKVISLDVKVSLNEEEAYSLLRILESVNGTIWRGFPENIHALRDELAKALDPNHAKV